MNPLDGLRVIDLTHAISGPTCTNALGQMGAEIIKIEPPDRGDGFRHYTEHGGEPMLSVPFEAEPLTLRTPSPVARCPPQTP